MRPSLSRLVVARSGSAWVDQDTDDLAAWAGERDWHVDRVEAKDLDRDRVELDETTLVVGSIQSVRAALRRLGVAVPPADDYPDTLRPYVHRRIWTSSLGNLRARLDAGDEPVFAKPQDLKRFTGQVFENTDDLRAVGSLTRHLPLWCSQVVVWRSEWRVFVVDDHVVGQRHYTGEPWTRPDLGVVTDCVDRLAAERANPAGYAIDFGILDDGRTALVERNDGFAIGSYGLETSLYAAVLIARWSQLLATAATANPSS